MRQATSRKSGLSVGIKRDAADSWFSKCIRLRAEWRCESCHKQYDSSSTGLHCAHIYGRANKSTRWDEGNALALCYACHQRYTANPLDFRAFLERYLGEGHLELLNERRNRIFKTTKAIRDEIAKHYREEFRRMEETNKRDLVGY